MMLAFGHGCEQDVQLGRRWLLRSKKVSKDQNELVKSASKIGGIEHKDLSVNDLIKFASHIIEFEKAKEYSIDGLTYQDRIERFVTETADSGDVLKDFFQFSKRGRQNPPTPKAKPSRQLSKIPEMLIRAEQGSKTAQTFFAGMSVYKMVSKQSEKLFLSAAEGQRPRNYLSCCSWIFRLIYALSTSTSLTLPLFLSSPSLSQFPVFTSLSLATPCLSLTTPCLSPSLSHYSLSLPMSIYLCLLTCIYLLTSTYLPIYIKTPTYVNLPSSTYLPMSTYLLMSIYHLTYIKIPTYLCLPNNIYQSLSTYHHLPIYIF